METGLKFELSTTVTTYHFKVDSGSKPTAWEVPGIDNRHERRKAVALRRKGKRGYKNGGFDR